MTTKPTQSMQLYPAVRPGLEAGIYDIAVTQTASAPGAEQPFDERYAVHHRVEVTGPRFAFAPALITAFPPKGRGAYENCLPHVMLASAALPWLRDATRPASGVPWLAVLLFDSAAFPAPPAVVRHVSELATTNPVGLPVLPPGVLSYGTADPAYAPETGESWKDSCTTIDIEMDTFKALAPGAAELPWLCHAREPFADLAGTDPSGERVSLIMGNRLIQNDARCEYTAHLVSLEGMSAYLEVANWPAGTMAVRLVSLYSWTFTSQEPAETFSGFFDNPKFTIAPLGLSAATGQADLDNALMQGYVPVEHVTRQGERTVSWYRGAGAPFPVPAGSVAPETARSADGLTSYDEKDTAMFDLHLSAPWQIGRWMGLADGGFAQELLNWKAESEAAAAAATLQVAIRRALGVG